MPRCHGVLVSCAAIVVCFGALGDVIRVPQDQPTIQAGIDASRDGDIVQLADRVFRGPGNRDVNFRGKAITVSSANGPQRCIIDCQGLGRAFLFVTGELNDSRVVGITIRNGLADEGGAILISAQPTIQDCIFEDNRARGASAARGGAIYANGDEPKILRCIFRRNTAAVQGGTGNAYGGAVWAAGNDPVIDECVFDLNWARDGWGGAVFVDDLGFVTDCVFRNNWVSGSQSRGGGRGGALCTLGATWDVHRCYFEFNRAFGFNPQGGAFYSEAVPCIIEDCFFINNQTSASNGQGYGGALRAADLTFISGSTFAGNAADFGGAISTDVEPVSISGSAFCANRPQHIHGDWTNKGNNSFCVPAELTDITIIDGTIIAGGLAQLADSDDEVLELEARVTGEVHQPHLLHFQVGAISPADAAEHITVTYESRITDVEATTSVSLHNWRDDGFEQIGSFTVTFAETVEVLHVGSAADFVRESDRRIELRVRQVVFLPFTLNGFHSLIDQLVIEVQ